MAGRKRIALGPKGEEIVDAAARNGASSDRVQKDLAAVGIRISLRTVKARLAERRGRMRVERIDRGKSKGARAKAAAKPPLQGEIRQPAVVPLIDPKGKSSASLEEDLVEYREARRKAAIDGNWVHFGMMARQITATEEAIRKARADQPTPPEADPDVRLQARKAREDLHKMVEQVLGAKP